MAPASLLANWTAEIGRFAPSLKSVVAHPSVMPAEQLKVESLPKALPVPISSSPATARWRVSPGSAPRLGGWSFSTKRRRSRTPAAKQTRAVKALKAETRIALTGTPIENRLGDLWSIFDFVNPGLLGSAKQFSGFVKNLADRPQNPYGPLRDLVRPYILRRLKTDKSIIADLPDKTEVKTFCPLSRKQAALYSRPWTSWPDQLEQVDGIRAEVWYSPS